MKKRKALSVVILIFLLIIAGGYYQLRQFAASTLAITQPTIFVLPAGSGRMALQAELKKQHILTQSHWLSLLLTLHPGLAKFKAGTYRFQPGMSVKGMLQLLVSGKEAQFPIRFVEGTRLQEWLHLLQTAPYVKHTLPDSSPETLAAALKVAPDRLEGRFWPDTYLYTANTSDVTILQRAYQRMEKEMTRVWMSKKAGLPYENKHQLLTMASIIEKETALNEERPLIASVFVNRLRLGMRLQTDPTVIYGMGERYQGNLTRKDLATPGVYNTYLIDGLPPGPIAMPSGASLDAAAHPADSHYLYFVADGHGGHIFNTNLASHNQAVQAWRLSVKEKNEK